MIQFNLLPDVKIQFIKARRTKHLMELVSVVLVIVSIVVFSLVFTTVNIVQKKSLRDLNRDITTGSNQLKNEADLSKILTVQNQLGTLDSLHNAKPVASRLFGYLTQVTPSKASISNLNIDFVANTITIAGNASGLDVINTFTDTLKATTYISGTSTTAVPAFKKIVLGTFSRGTGNATSAFSIAFSFDPLIFGEANVVKLNVPAGTTVDPAALFQKQSGGV